MAKDRNHFRVPKETYTSICEFLPSEKDIRNLSHTCQDFFKQRNLVRHLEYQHLKLNCLNENSICGFIDKMHRLVEHQRSTNFACKAHTITVKNYTSFDSFAYMFNDDAQKTDKFARVMDTFYRSSVPISVKSAVVRFNTQLYADYSDEKIYGSQFFERGFNILMLLAPKLENLHTTHELLLKNPAGFSLFARDYKNLHILDGADVLTQEWTSTDVRESIREALGRMNSLTTCSMGRSDSLAKAVSWSGIGRQDPVRGNMPAKHFTLDVRRFRGSDSSKVQDILRDEKPLDRAIDMFTDYETITIKGNIWCNLGELVTRHRRSLKRLTLCLNSGERRSGSCLYTIGSLHMTDSAKFHHCSVLTHLEVPGYGSVAYSNSKVVIKLPSPTTDILLDFLTLPLTLEVLRVEMYVDDVDSSHYDSEEEDEEQGHVEPWNDCPVDLLQSLLDDHIRRLYTDQDQTSRLKKLILAIRLPGPDVPNSSSPVQPPTYRTQEELAAAWHHGDIQREGAIVEKDTLGIWYVDDATEDVSMRDVA